jgi:spore germination protein
MRRTIVATLLALGLCMELGFELGFGLGLGLLAPANAAERRDESSVRNGGSRQTQAWAYLAWWMPDSWRSRQFSRLDRVLFFDLSVDEDGAIADDRGWPHRWGDLRQAVTASKIPLELTLSLLDEERFRRLFSSAAATARLQHTALALTRDPAVAGIHLDFEVYGPMPAQAVARFRRFVIELSQALRENSPAKSLTVFLPIGVQNQIYDRPSLRATSQVVAQGYDAHWLGSPSAGPIAPLAGTSAVTWEKAMRQAQALGVRRDRMLMSYPLFGYEWPTEGPDPKALTRGDGIRTTLADVAEEYLPAIRVNVAQRLRNIAPQRDDLSGSMYYQFENGSGWHTGWFEGLWSLQRKADFAASHGLAGAAFFVLGYDGGSLVDTFLARRAERR